MGSTPGASSRLLMLIVFLLRTCSAAHTRATGRQLLLSRGTITTRRSVRASAVAGTAERYTSLHPAITLHHHCCLLACFICRPVWLLDGLTAANEANVLAQLEQGEW